MTEISISVIRCIFFLLSSFLLCYCLPAENVSGPASQPQLFANGELVKNSVLNNKSVVDLGEKKLVLTDEKLESKQIIPQKENLTLDSEKSNNQKVNYSVSDNMGIKSSPQNNSVSSKILDHTTSGSNRNLSLQLPKEEKQATSDSTSEKAGIASDRNLQTNTFNSPNLQSVVPVLKPIQENMDQTVQANDQLSQSESKAVKESTPSPKLVGPDSKLQDQFPLPSNQDQPVHYPELDLDSKKPKESQKEENKFELDEDQDIYEPMDKNQGSNYVNNETPKEIINPQRTVFPNKEGEIYNDANSHFFAYFLTMMVMVVLFYLLFHNKQRIIALMIEGRSQRNSRRMSRARYHKLDNNLEEAMSSTRGNSSGLGRVF